MSLDFPPPPYPSAPADPRAAVRWGIPDFVSIYVAGLVGSIVLGTVGLGFEGLPDTPGALALGLMVLGQYAVWVAGLFVVSRVKGLGTWAADFGVRLRLRRLWVVFAGVFLQWACALLVLPITVLVKGDNQQIVDELQDASGAKLAVLIVTAVLAAPVLEEILFRGLLLRALRRRMSVWPAIVVSSLVFACVHLLDFKIGTVASVPALFAFGVVSAVCACWAGDLSLSIPLHVGFNLVTVLAIVLLG